MSQTHYSRTASQWARSHPNIMRELGPPDNRLRFTGDAILVIAGEDESKEFETVVGAQQIRAMIANDIIRQVKKGVYQLNSEPYDAAREKWENAATMPCGHTGFSNLGDGEYTCSFDYCDERFDRETVKAAFDGGDE